MLNNVYQLIAPKNIEVKLENIDLKSCELIVKPLYMSLCHADQRYYTGSRDVKILKKKLPMALIHECCGQIVWDRDGRIGIGKKVILIPNIPGDMSEGTYENYSKGSAFLSSGKDGFMREYVSIKYDRVIEFENIDLDLASISEFISIGVHAINRFRENIPLEKDKIGIWGDGSLAYVLANLLKKEFPEKKIIVIGKNQDKLRHFSFVDETILLDDINSSFSIGHAFECVGGEGSNYAIDDIIKYIEPQGNVLLLGVSENKIFFNTRDVLEKGLTFVGCSRSGYNDFKKTIEYLQDKNLQSRLKTIIHDAGKVSSINDLQKIFELDLLTEFKTVFEWGI